MAFAGLALFILGLIFVIVAPINKRKNARCSAQTEGRLRDAWIRSHPDGAAGHSYVYSYSVNGVEYQIRSTIRTSQANGPEDTCTIWYNPNKPEEAQPFHYDSVKVYNIILILGIVLIPSGLILSLVGLVLQSM